MTAEPDPFVAAAQLAEHFERGDLYSDELTDHAEDWRRAASALLELVQGMPAGKCPPALRPLGARLTGLLESVSVIAENLSVASRAIGLADRMMRDPAADRDDLVSAYRTLSSQAVGLESHAKLLAACAVVLELRTELARRGWYRA